MGVRVQLLGGNHFMGIEYCSHCGKKVSYGIPSGDDHERYYCGSCGHVHYQNPRMVVGALPEHNGRILMCRRAIEPCYGLWTLPAGYLENGETVTAGAIRETREEACADIANLSAYTLYSIPHINQVYLIFRSDLAKGTFEPGPESLEVKLFEVAQIPWDDLAFRAIKATLNCYKRDLAEGRFRFHVGEIDRPGYLKRQDS